MPLRRPNRLVVDESTSDDNSVAQLNPATMETLQLFRGDTIIVRGKKRKDTGQSLSLSLMRTRVCWGKEETSRCADTIRLLVLIVLSSDDVDEGRIQINKGRFHLSLPSRPAEKRCLQIFPSPI